MNLIAKKFIILFRYVICVQNQDLRMFLIKQQKLIKKNKNKHDEPKYTLYKKHRKIRFINTREFKNRTH